MRITGYESNERIMQELGQRIKDTRISMNYTQMDLAEHSGVALSTISRIEQGESVNVEKLLNVLRSLGVLANLELLLQEQTIRPTDLADKKGKRQRASRSQKRLSEGNWMWGEDKT